ncbi:MAG: lysoplasmalogenase, partial [Bacteroidaceae bacterium]|nr:lysoplasmalogenase [Bacteroidaceae bacterium]
GKPEEESLLFALRLALPAALLALGGIGLVPALMTFGFVFCAIGDAMGVLGSFEGQMAGFALAHICFITYFVSNIWKPHPVVLIATTLLCLVPLALAAKKIIPAIHNTPIRIGCIIYALLLTGTVWTSIIRAFFEKRSRNALPLVAALGALLFLVSDFILSWNKFTERIPHASLYIMTTYYAALLLLFIGTLLPSKQYGIDR